ncbi:MAG: transcription termination factor NusA [Chlamydiales bacterium]|nr:transcription termination factor NusA [Chlamydiales bacterium]
MNKDLLAIFEYMEREKGIKRDIIIAAIEESLRAAARKSAQGIANVSVHINSKTGDIEVLSEREIVETSTDPSEEISLEDARVLDPECEIGQVIDIVITPKDFGRIAAQTARQIISQKIRGAERDVIYEEYRHRINEIVSGSVKRFSKGINLVVDLGKVEAILPAKHYPKTERYQVGDKIHALLLNVVDLENGGAEVVLSRTDPEFVKQLFINEVPEINEGIISIEKIVRDPGYRTKILVRSNDLKVDGVGACVGIRGTRVKNVVRELNNEKIDIIPYSDDAIEILQNALAPIEIRKISVNEENGEEVISIVVDDKDFAIVIGKRGMNARLNGDLIGYSLDVQRMSDYTRAMAIQQSELIASDDSSLDEPLDIPGINTLVIQNLLHAGFDTARKVLSQKPEELMKVPGISLDMAYTILEQVSKKRI